MRLRPWSEVDRSLAPSGRALDVHYDADTVTVFAAHSEAIGRYAVEHQTFGGAAWQTDRISRFRVSLPRVMARSRRGERDGKQMVLGVTLRRANFDAVLRQAVHWREFPASLYETKGQWRLATRYTQVVMDWAPDSDPSGADLERFTVRFGVRAHSARAYASEWIVRIEDLTELAEVWRTEPDPPTPVVRPYPIPEPALEARLRWQPEGD